MTHSVETVAIHEATRERYVSYALSVITSRALPDVRDGLKPVQRRILYAMFHDLALHPTGRYRKCAAVVGDVMGKYHPHGDSSIYEALARMAQDFSLRAPLVDGQGNFGSLDGDPPAAMRYTECRLRPIAEEMLTELRADTVEVRPTYDGQRDEPVVLPAQFPQLLVNGCEGIAVGIATRIPPHNLAEVIDAAVAIIDHGELDAEALMRWIPGPDFPTGGRIINDRREIVDLYASGRGTLRVQAEWTTEKDGRRNSIVITSVPFGQNKAKLVERIGAEVMAKKLPQVTDVRDESTEDVRVVLDLKQGAVPEQVMAWLYKRTALESTFPVQMNALVPPDDGGVPMPHRLSLYELLDHWIKFRIETVRRRFTHDLRLLEERIHILEGFRLIFLDLDEAIRIIRNSEGRADAANKLIERFGLTRAQADAILELRLYRLAQLEIQLILDELQEKQAKAEEIRTILASEALLIGRVRHELLEIRNIYGDKRRTQITGPVAELEFDEENYIVREQTWVIVTRDGWAKRQSSISDVAKVRMRDGDTLGWVYRTDTTHTLTFFTNLGGAYTLRADQVVQTTGHGEPVQTHFSFDNGERVIGVIPHDPRHLPPSAPDLAPVDPPPPHAVAVTLRGRIVRFPLAALAEESNKNGRRFARLDDGDVVFAVYPSNGAERVCLASTGGRASAFHVSEAPPLKSPGKGTTAVKLDDGDQIMAFELAADDTSGPRVTVRSATKATPVTITYGAHGTARGTAGHTLIRRGTVEDWQREPVLGLLAASPSEAGDPTPAPAEEA